MTEITRVGADLAKAVIQAHAVDRSDKVITNRPLARDKFMAWCDERIAAHAKVNEQVRQAEQLAGIGTVTASAVMATVGNFKQFRNGSQFGAWLGLTPRQNSSGGKNNLSSITKRGDMYLRMLLIQGAKSAAMIAMQS
jgi:transposase